MAEAFGILGSAASLAGFLNQIFRTHDLYNTIKDAPADVQSLATNIAVFVSTLNDSTRCSEQLESLGYDVEQFRSSFQETVKWLERAKKSVEHCAAEAGEGRWSRTKKRFSYILNGKKIRDQSAGFERMNTNTIEAKSNLNR